MSPEIISFMILIPVAVAGALGLAVFGGRLPAMVRSRMELALIGVFYPVAVGAFVWMAFESALAQDWLTTGVRVAFAGFLGGQAIVMVRKRITALRGRP